MSLGGWLSEPVDDPSGLCWPRWVPLTVAGSAVAVAVAALAQRDALVPPGMAVVAAVLAVSPWLVDCVGGRAVPPAVFVGCVIAGSYWLLLDPVPSDMTPFLLVLMMLEVGATCRPVVTAVAVVASIVPIVVLDVAQEAGSWWVWLPGIAAGGLAGLAAQTQVRLLAQERATRSELAQRLAAEQRREVAREVHDVVAHSLGVTMLHLTAARHALEADEDVDEAVESLRDAERVGRQAMGDIRRTVGLLDASSGDTRPLPGVEDVPALVEEFRAAGIEVAYGDRGRLDDLAPSVGLAVFRVTQEALANVAKHAPGAQVTVAVEAGDEAVLLRVDSSLPAAVPATAAAAGGGAGDGRGLRGMRERIDLLGGHLEVGPTATGWHVAATFPRRPSGPDTGS
jgi:signal transduction histidine kinase